MAMVRLHRLHLNNEERKKIIIIIIIINIKKYIINYFRAFFNTAFNRKPAANVKIC